MAIAYPKENPEIIPPPSTDPKQPVIPEIVPVPEKDDPAIPEPEIVPLPLPETEPEKEEAFSHATYAKEKIQ